MNDQPATAIGQDSRHKYAFYHTARAPSDERVEPTRSRAPIGRRRRCVKVHVNSRGRSFLALHCEIFSRFTFLCNLLRSR